MLLTTDFEIVLLYNMDFACLRAKWFCDVSISIFKVSSSVLLKAETIIGK